MESKRKREPLSDCTNPTTHPLSSSKKNPFLATLLNDLNGNTRPCSTASPTSVTTREVTSANPSFDAVTSTPCKSSRVSGTDCRHDVVEFCSAYARRSTANKRKSKDKEVGIPVAGSSAANIETAGAGDKIKEYGDTVQNRSCTMHRRKKRKHNEDALHAMPQGFIEKQKAYFADVDKFSLLEEEVESVDQLE